MTEIGVDNIIDRLRSEYVNTLKSKITNIEELLSDTESPLSLIGLKTDDSVEKILFRSDKVCSEYNNCSIDKLSDIVDAVRVALNDNNGYDEYESFSESLIIALFKYRAQELSIIRTYTNSILIHLLVNGFSWCSMDDEGTRYFQAETDVVIPLKYIFNREVCKRLIDSSIEYIRNYDGTLIEDMYEIDSIENWSIEGFTIDVSDSNKNDLNTAVHLIHDISSTGIKPVISNKIDRECITYANDVSFNIGTDRYRERRTDVIDCIKLYTLLKLWKYNISADIVKNTIYAEYENVDTLFQYIDTYLYYTGCYEKKYIIDFIYNKMNKYSQNLSSIIDILHDNRYIGNHAMDLYNKHIRNFLY